MEEFFHRFCVARVCQHQLGFLVNIAFMKYLIGSTGGSEAMKEPGNYGTPMNRLRYFSDFLFLCLVAVYKVGHWSITSGRRSFLSWIVHG